MGQSVLIFLTSFSAALFASLSGGSASAIAVPVFLLLGLSYPQAMATQLFTGAFYTFASAWNYLRGQVVQWKFIMIFCLLGIVGVYGGVHAIVGIDEHLLAPYIGFLLLCVLALIAHKSSIGLRRRNVSPHLLWISYLFAPLLGFYEGIFGAGNTILFSLTVLETRSMLMMEALGHYYVITTIWCAAGGLLLFDRGYFDASLILPALVGSLGGGYVGSACSRRGGNRFTKILFLLMGILLALKLILFP